MESGGGYINSGVHSSRLSSTARLVFASPNWCYWLAQIESHWLKGKDKNLQNCCHRRMYLSIPALTNQTYSKHDWLTLLRPALDQLAEELPGTLYSRAELSHDKKDKGVTVGAPSLSQRVARDWPDSRAVWSVLLFKCHWHVPFLTT